MTNLTKNTEKVFIIETSDSDCYTAWKQDRDAKKAAYEAARQTYKDLPSVKNWDRMWDARNDYEATNPVHHVLNK